MVVAPINLLGRDERGVAYIAGTRMKVAQIAYESTTLNYTPAIAIVRSATWRFE